jgi:hypothetical protein
MAFLVVGLVDMFDDGCVFASCSFNSRAMFGALKTSDPKIILMEMEVRNLPIS